MVVVSIGCSHRAVAWDEAEVAFHRETLHWMAGCDMATVEESIPNLLLVVPAFSAFWSPAHTVILRAAFQRKKVSVAGDSHYRSLNWTDSSSKSDRFDPMKLNIKSSSLYR